MYELLKLDRSCDIIIYSRSIGPQGNSHLSLFEYK